MDLALYINTWFQSVMCRPIRDRALLDPDTELEQTPDDFVMPEDAATLPKDATAFPKDATAFPKVTLSTNKKTVVCSSNAADLDALISQIMSQKPRPSNRPLILAIEGNIGAGKSTLLEAIRVRLAAKNEKGIICMQEPVGLWETVRDSATGESILQKFYRNPKTYAFAFQVMAYTSRLAAFQKVVAENPDCRLILCERSLEADRNIFAKMMRDDGMIDEVSYQVYETLYDSTSRPFAIDAIFYLDVEPVVCLQRVCKRAREGESEIDLNYLSKCDSYYQDFIAGFQ